MSQKNREQGETDPVSSESRSRLLVVEDNTDTQELLLLILQDKYDVTLTANAPANIRGGQKREL